MSYYERVVVFNRAEDGTYKVRQEEFVPGSSPWGDLWEMKTFFVPTTLNNPIEAKLLAQSTASKLSEGIQR